MMYVHIQMRGGGAGREFAHLQQLLRPGKMQPLPAPHGPGKLDPNERTVFVSESLQIVRRANGATQGGLEHITRGPALTLPGT